MSDYLFCTTSPDAPGVIEIHASKEDPRLETLEAKLRRREMGIVDVQWTLRVVDRALSEAALCKALRQYRQRGKGAAFTCSATHARSEAVKLTTLRADPRKGRKLSLMRRLIRAA